MLMHLRVPCPCLCLFWARPALREAAHQGAEALILKYDFEHRNLYQLESHDQSDHHQIHHHKLRYFLQIMEHYHH